jgi:hypothetical protein
VQNFFGIHHLSKFHCGTTYTRNPRTQSKKKSMLNAVIKRSHILDGTHSSPDQLNPYRSMIRPSSYPSRLISLATDEIIYYPMLSYLPSTSDLWLIHSVVLALVASPVPGVPCRSQRRLVTVSLADILPVRPRTGNEHQIDRLIHLAPRLLPIRVSPSRTKRRVRSPSHILLARGISPIQLSSGV